ncbi:MAG TPA: hypothetical protein PK819_09665, partial [Thermomicrobiales bacterium]|nr:hypothetical protein [Thermomicrobiales bacterium]
MIAERTALRESPYPATKGYTSLHRKRISRRALVGGAAAAATLGPRTYEFAQAQEAVSWQEDPLRWPSVILPHCRVLTYYGFPGV